MQIEVRQSRVSVAEALFDDSTSILCSVVELDETNKMGTTSAFGFWFQVHKKVNFKDDMIPFDDTVWSARGNSPVMKTIYEVFATQSQGSSGAYLNILRKLNKYQKKTVGNVRYAMQASGKQEHSDI